MEASSTPLFQTLYITQDDNAEYGFNIAEARNLKARVSASTKLSSVVKLYPGADEVGLTMLAKLTTSINSNNNGVSKHQNPISKHQNLRGGVQGTVMQLVFRDPRNSSLMLIPNYEGQPMILTLLQQMVAAGGVPVTSQPAVQAAIQAYCAQLGLCDAIRAAAGTTLPNITLLVNNFDDSPQIEAPVQPTAGRSIADYAAFTPYVCSQSNGNNNIIGFVDNRYSNGTRLQACCYMY